MTPTPLPPTVRLDQQDTYLLEFESRVLATRSAADGPELALESTAFYAESGGQPSDRGSLAECEVIAVSAEEGVVWHRVHALDPSTIADLLPGSRIRGRVDSAVRLDHMQQHTGQHILSQAFLRVGGPPTISFHLGAEESTIDLRGAKPELALLEVAMIEANDCVLADRPVRIHQVEREALARYPLRRDATADVDVLRLIEIEDWDWSACGGTHARRTGEVGPIQILGVERIRGDWRIRFVAGRRALAYLRAAHRLLEETAREHSLHWTALPQAAAAWKTAAAEAERELRRLRVERGAREAERLAAAAPMTAAGERYLAYWSETITADELRATAARFVELGPAFFLGGAREGDRAHWVAAQGSAEQLPPADRLLQEWLAEIGGKGGGNDRMARGSSAAPAQDAAELQARLEAWIQKRMAKGRGVSD